MSVKFTLHGSRFLAAAQSTPVRESAAANVGVGGASPAVLQQQTDLLALHAKTAATKLKERLATTKEYLSQQNGAYRHHTVIPSDACVALFPEWNTDGPIPKFPSLDEVIKAGTGLGVLDGRKSRTSASITHQLVRSGICTALPPVRNYHVLAVQTAQRLIGRKGCFW